MMIKVKKVSDNEQDGKKILTKLTDNNPGNLEATVARVAAKEAWFVDVQRDLFKNVILFRDCLIIYLLHESKDRWWI